MCPVEKQDITKRWQRGRSRLCHVWYLLLVVYLLIVKSTIIITELQNICKQRSLPIVYENSRGIQTNFENLRAVVDNHKIDIITLSETHITNPEPQDLYCIDGYYLVTRDRVDGKGGGVCIYVRKEINWERRED